MSKRKWIAYPKDQGYRGGCKVAWHYFTDEADAKACAEAAKKCYKATMNMTGPEAVEWAAKNYPETF